MRVIVVGATGMLGQAVVRALESRGHDVVPTSRQSTIPVDITNPSSISAMFASVGRFDALAAAVGTSPMGSLPELTLDDFRAALNNKLLGQVDLVRQGLPTIAEGGSFTLVSGISSEEPIRDGTALATVNAAVDGYVRGAAPNAPRGIRINSVSATLFDEAAPDYGNQFPGYPTVPVATVAKAFIKSIEGVNTGRNYRVGY